jgi:DNA-directed RNA polymerase subunit M/transcription elongation factor TFIIS
MEFCEVCDNMLYLSNVEDEMSLIHLCKKCGFQRKSSEGTTLVSSLSFSKQAPYTSAVNQYTKLDPTLPRIQGMPCPKPDCENHKLARDIIYIRYDNVDLKYAYLCPICDTVWKTDKN